MKIMEERIEKFIKGHHVMTLATVENNVPHCSSIFYVYDAEKSTLYFMSSPDTMHIRQALKQPLVAGTITPGHVSIARIQGIQFTGKFFQPKGEEFKKAKSVYVNRFLVARFMSSSFWALELHSIKMTDNTLGFGKKLHWDRLKEIEQV